MARIFLSYAHEDQAAAKRIVDALARDGLEAWWDHEIPPGRSWDEVIGQRIASADIVMVIWSARSIESNFVKEEAQIAYDAGKLLPLRIDDVEPPVGFRRVHAANLVGWRGEAGHQQWQTSLSEIRSRLGDVAVRPAIAKRTAAPPNRRLSFSIIAVAALALVVVSVVMFVNRSSTGTQSEITAVEADDQTAGDQRPAEAPQAPAPQPANRDANMGSAVEEAGGAAAEAPPAASVPSVADTTWLVEQQTGGGSTIYAWRFNADGSAEWGDSPYRFIGRETYRWTQHDAEIRWGTGESAYTGAVNSDVMTVVGTYNGARHSTFRLRRR
jgi:hypothetical protein